MQPALIILCAQNNKSRFIHNIARCHDEWRLNKIIIFQKFEVFLRDFVDKN